MTDLDLRAGQIHRGLGIVARWPDIALVIPSDAAHDAIVDDMFHAVGPEPSSSQLVEAVNELLAQDKLRSVGIVVEATGGPLGMAHGPVEILVDGELAIDGSRGPARSQLSSQAHRLTIRAGNLAKAAEPVAPYDLRRGIAPGAGLTLITIAVAEPPAPANLAPVVPRTPADRPVPEAGPSPFDPTVATIEPPGSASALADAPEPGPPPGVRSGRYHEPSFDAEPGPVRPPAPEPVPRERSAPAVEAVPDQAAERRAQPAVEPAPMAVPFRSVVLVGQAPDEASPLPIATAPRTGELTRGELDAGRAEVDGILCSRDHFNNPEAAYCMVCGISMLHLTHDLVRGPRPTLGFIVFDDGSTFGLDRSYVVGREPVVPAGTNAERLVLHDNNETLSRTHAELRLVDWTVQLVDLQSTNGTYVWDRALEQWNQLAAGQPVELASGETVALGRRTFVFESVSRT